MNHHIYLFRHGETYYNRSRRFTGRRNSRLTPQGIRQTEVIAEKLRDKTFNIAFQTSLSRSSDSLRIVLRYHLECQQIVVDDRMIERSYGDLEGKLHTTIIRQFEQRQFDIWHRSYDVPPPGGESIQKVEERVLAFISDLLVLIERKRVNVVISAHSNSLRPFRRHFEHLTIEQMMSLENPQDTYFDYLVKL